VMLVLAIYLLGCRCQWKTALKKREPRISQSVALVISI
jgi:hypothetical protein